MSDTKHKEEHEPKQKAPTADERLGSVEFRLGVIESKLNIKNLPGPAGDQPVPTVEGRVVAVGSDRFTVEDDAGNRTVHKVPTDLELTMGGKATKLKDVKENDTVKVVGLPNGKAQSAEFKRGKE